MGPTTSTLPAFYLRRGATLDRLRQERQACVDFVTRTLDEVEKNKRDLSDTEDESLKRQKDRIKQLDLQIASLAEFEELRGASNDTVRSYSQTSPERPDEGGQERGQSGGSLGFKVEQRKHDYKTRGEVIVDVIAQRTGQYDAAGGTVAITEAMRSAAQERLMGAGVMFPGAPDEYVKRVMSNEITTDVPGLLPKPIVGAVDNDLDAARPFISSIGARDLGSIPGKTFTRPIVTQHTTVGKQSAEKTELPSQKMKVDGVDFTKETYGGTLDVSRQTIDWTSPAAWDALLNDLQDVYGITTEDVAAKAFATAVTASVEAPATDDLKGWSTAIYKAAAKSYGGVKRMPDHMWVSLDMWAQMGSIVDVARLSLKRGDNSSLGTQSPTSFEGNVLDLPRTVVPSLPDGTVIIGVKSKTEFYEQRIGLLTAVEPRLLGVEIAYGGYIAYGTLRASAFAKVAPAVEG